MKFYNFTLKKATGITQAVNGNFTGKSEREIVISHGKVLQLIRWDNQITTLCTVEAFCSIQSMSSLRLPTKSKDYLVISSDSGILVVVKYNMVKKGFEKVCELRYAEGGMKTYIPGQYLAVNGEGNLIMIGAIEKQKSVFALETHPKVSFSSYSPLQVCNPNLLLYDVVSIESESGKTLFVCLEANYEVSGNATDPIRPQKLSFYEVDLPGKNVVEKCSELLEERANFLISVPGEHLGRGGVIVCCENYILYKNVDTKTDICCPIPRRKSDLEDPERDMIFVSSTTSKTVPPFFLLQTEQGDVFKVTLNVDENVVSQIILQYLDTVPVAISLCLLENRFLFVAAEFGPHHFYELLDNVADMDRFNSDMAVAGRDSFIFTPHDLRHMTLITQLSSLSPIMHCQVLNTVNRCSPHIFLACGRGPVSSLQRSQIGFKVKTIQTIPCDYKPEAVWSLKKNAQDYFDTYIITSFSNMTSVLLLDVPHKNLTSSDFIQTSRTLACSQLGADGFIQICPEVIRIVRRGNTMDWQLPTIERCVIDQAYIILAMTSRTLEFLKIDKQDSSYSISKLHSLNYESGDISSMLLTDVVVENNRLTVLIIGSFDGQEGCLQIIPVGEDHDNPGPPLSLPGIPVSLASVKIEDKEKQIITTYLFVGLQNGRLLVTMLNPENLDLMIIEMNKLGTSPVTVYTVKYMNTPAVLATSNSSWLNYYCNNGFHLRPLASAPMDYVASYCHDQCKEGITAIIDMSLNIMKIEELDCSFTETSYPLKKTPRKFVIHPSSDHVVLIGTDHNAYTEKTKMRQNEHSMLPEDINVARAFMDEDASMTEKLPDSVFDAPRGDLGMWASTVLVLDPFEKQAVFRRSLDQNEAAFSVSFVKFSSQDEGEYLIVGIAKEMYINPVICNGGIIDLYSVVTTDNDDDENRRISIQSVHTTEVEEAPAAICPFQGKVLIGVGKMLRIYDIGKRKLLRKCENKDFPNRIISIHSVGNLIIVGDVQESFFFLGYKAAENCLVMLSRQTNVNYLTCATLVGKRTIVAADKFRNISLIRFPSFEGFEEESSPDDEIELWDRGWSNKFSEKSDVIGQFHVGEMVTSLQKLSLFPDCVESILYTTLSGSIGILAPLVTEKEQEFCENLEKLMRAKSPSLCGRDHLSYRSYYSAVKNIIDGDLCEHFRSLDSTQQKEIAEKLQREPYEVLTQLQTLRVNYAL